MTTNNSNQVTPIKNNSTAIHYRHMFPYISLLKEVGTFMKECVRDDNWDDMTKEELHRKMAYISTLSRNAAMRLSDIYASFDHPQEEPEVLNLDEFLDDFYMHFPESEWEVDYERCDDSFENAGFEVPRPSFDLKQMRFTSVTAEYVDAKVYIDYGSLYSLCESIVWNAIYNGFSDEDKAHEVKIWLSANATKKMFEVEFVSDVMPSEHPLDQDCKNGFSAWREAEMQQIVERFGGDYEIENNGKLLFVRIYLPFYQE